MSEADPCPTCGYQIDRVAHLNTENARLRAALKAARDKLVIYRAERNGEYTGGMEYTALMKLIDTALEQKANGEK